MKIVKSSILFLIVLALVLGTCLMPGIRPQVVQPDGDAVYTVVEAPFIGSAVSGGPTQVAWDWSLPGCQSPDSFSLKDCPIIETLVNWGS
jgi:hypothetical protein